MSARPLYLVHSLDAERKERVIEHYRQIQLAAFDKDGETLHRYAAKVVDGEDAAHRCDSLALALQQLHLGALPEPVRAEIRKRLAECGYGVTPENEEGVQS